MWSQEKEKLCLRQFYFSNVKVFSGYSTSLSEVLWFSFHSNHRNSFQETEVMSEQRSIDGGEGGRRRCEEGRRKRKTREFQ